jgi:hypothetical protein
VSGKSEYFSRFKKSIKSSFPFLVRIWNKIQYSTLALKSPHAIFNDIFHKNKWSDAESFSGPGSNLSQTEAVRKALPQLLKEYKCRSFLDIPCGDYYWMRLVEMEGIEYIGGDIVEDLTENNQRQFGDKNHIFKHLDLLQDKIPQADFIFCRDCLVHFSFQHIFRALKNIKESGSAYLLTTTFVERDANDNILTGAWRPINLQLPPFNFPEPIQLVDEQCPVVGQSDKRLGLWKIQNLPDYQDN